MSAIHELIHLLHGDGLEPRKSVCGQILGWKCKRVHDEYETADNMRFEMVRDRKRVTCKRCLAVRSATPGSPRS